MRDVCEYLGKAPKGFPARNAAPNLSREFKMSREGGWATAARTLDGLSAFGSGVSSKGDVVLGTGL